MAFSFRGPSALLRINSAEKSCPLYVAERFLALLGMTNLRLFRIATQTLRRAGVGCQVPKKQLPGFSVRVSDVGQFGMMECWNIAHSRCPDSSTQYSTIPVFHCSIFLLRQYSSFPVFQFLLTPDTRNLSVH